MSKAYISAVKIEELSGSLRVKASSPSTSAEAASLPLRELSVYIKLYPGKCGLVKGRVLCGLVKGRVSFGLFGMDNFKVYIQWGQSPGWWFWKLEFSYVFRMEFEIFNSILTPNTKCSYRSRFRLKKATIFRFKNYIMHWVLWACNNFRYILECQFVSCNWQRQSLYLNSLT